MQSKTNTHVQDATRRQMRDKQTMRTLAGTWHSSSLLSSLLFYFIFSRGADCDAMASVADIIANLTLLFFLSNLGFLLAFSALR